MDEQERRSGHSRLFAKDEKIVREDGHPMDETPARRAAEEISVFRRTLSWHQECDFSRVLNDALAQAVQGTTERVEYALRMTEGCSAETVRSHVAAALRGSNAS